MSWPSAASRPMRESFRATPLGSAAITIRTVWSSCCRLRRARLLGSGGQVVGARGEEVLGRDGLVEDLLVDRVPNELVDHRAVGGDAVRQGVGAGDLRDPLVHPVGRARLSDAVPRQ